MGYSVLLKLARYEKKRHYDVPEQSVIIADILEGVQYLAMHNIEICLSAESYINNKVQNIHINHIINEVIVPYHNHDFYEINYVMSGTLFEYVGNETHVLSNGQMLIMNPAVYHSYYALEGTTAFNILVRHEYVEFLRNTLSEEGVQTLLTRLVALSSFAVLESTKNSFDSYIDQFESIEKRLSLHPKLLISYTESLFTQFMIDMIDGELRGDILTKYTNTSASRTPTAILQYVKDNYATLTLPELAAKFGYSESQIARIIKKYTGFTYSTSVMTLRINTATFLLKSTNYSVAQIAETVGIKSPEYFCRLYKKQVGYSPIQHKKYMYNEVGKNP